MDLANQWGMWQVGRGRRKVSLGGSTPRKEKKKMASLSSARGEGGHGISERGSAPRIVRRPGEGKIAVAGGIVHLKGGHGQK